MARRTNPALMKTWRDRIIRFEGANQTVAQFCESESISVPSFYQWKRRVADLAADADSSDRKLNADAKTSPAFSEVAFALTQTRPTMVRLTNGTIIELGNDTQLVETILNCVLASNSDAASAAEEPAC